MKKAAVKSSTWIIAVFTIQLILFLSLYAASANALTISNVKAAKVTANSATIEWDTDAAANGKVKYGKTSALGFVQRHENFVQKHSVALINGVTSDTEFLFAVESADASGKTVADNNSDSFYRFRTTDITPPNQVKGLSSPSKTSSSISLSWNALETADLSHYTVYRNKMALANTTSAAFEDTSAEPGKEYSYKVSATDKSSNEGPQSDSLIVSALGIDSVAPKLSDADVFLIIDTSARISWLTDENSTSMVLYGINKTDRVKSLSVLETNHSVTIEGLARDSGYNFTVKSCDSSNNCANLSGYSFRASRDSTQPQINFTIPRYISRRVIDIKGSTKPFSSVNLFVNDMNIPKRSLSGSETGSSGKFNFANIPLEQDNVIKLFTTDRYGNSNEIAFETSVDTEEPVVQLNQVAQLTSKKEANISGTVSEPVSIKIFVDANADKSSEPSKITNVNAAKIGQNSVELKWDAAKDKDFSHYVIYRGDVAIATAKPASFNLFTDVLIDSGREYSYHVTAVNVLGIEGQGSEELIVKTLDGGAILGIKPAPVDILEDFRKPLTGINATGNFNFSVKLDKGDGLYSIKLVFEDRAGNSVTLQKKTTLDTKKPEVKITSPSQSAFIYENMAQDIDIAGKTKPNAKVHLFVDRTPFTFYEQAVEASGLPNEATSKPKFEISLKDLGDRLQNLSEDRLDAKCGSNVALKSSCATGADRSTTADSEGNFKFEKVDLTTLFGAAARLREVPASEFRDTQLNLETREQLKATRKTTIVVIATDLSGQRAFASNAISIGNCWSGNQSWDVIPLTQEQRPALLSTERLAEGTEALFFKFNYSYIGRGTSPRIVSVSMAKACSNREQIDPRFNLSCQILQSGIPTPRYLNPPDNTITYSAVPLGRIQGIEEFVEKDWKEFLKSINREMSFPLRLIIRYQHDSDFDGELETETQTTCEQVSYVVDSALLDPRNAFPDWLTKGFAERLQQAVKGIDKLQEQVDRTLRIVSYGCIGSYLFNFGFQIYRRIVSNVEEVKINLALKSPVGGLGLVFTTANQADAEYCQGLAKDIAKKYNVFRFKYVNDLDLERCFKSVDSVWDKESKIYSLSRWSCDRVFGHSAPAKWTENQQDDELVTKASSNFGCAVDESVEGQSLKVEKCNELAKQFPDSSRNYGIDDKCVAVKGKSKRELYRIGNQQEGKLYNIEKSVSSSEVTLNYAIKNDDFNYFTAKVESCEEVCGISSSADTETFTIEGEAVVTPKDKPGKPNSKPAAYCTTTDRCRSLNVKDDKKKKITSSGGETIQVELARTKGYTNDCFYDPTKGHTASVVSENPAQRRECCCINTVKGPPSLYYNIYDVDPVTSQKVHESKTNPGKETDKLEDMKWSYRYFKERYEAKNTKKNEVHNQYNKYRYIEGRDKPACFGQNPLIGGNEKVLILDPFKQHTAALQCVHLAGIRNRLIFIKNLMSSMSTCLIQVSKTGKGDVGACKELFAQHLCGSIWQILRFARGGCAPNDIGIDFEKQNSNILSYVKNGFRGVSNSLDDLQSQFTDEYGNAKIHELVGTGQGGIAKKLCLNAIGYDWDMNIRTFVDAAYATPFATLVQPITKSREFLNVDPTTLKPRYEYRASWIINPGCDFEDYDVYLSCVGRKQLDNYPRSIKCGALGAPSIGTSITIGNSAGFSQCDCINLENGREGENLYTGTGKLRQNVLEDGKSVHKIVESDVRFDHLKFVLKPDRRIQANIRSNCFPTGYDDGIFYFPLTDKTPEDILDCRVDPASGSFICSGGTTIGKGIAHFMSIDINGIDISKTQELVFGAGESLNIQANVRKSGPDKCLRATLDGIDKGTTGITLNGTYPYQASVGELLITQRGRVEKTKNMEIIEKTLANNKPVSIRIRFIDTNKNEEIDLSQTSEDEIAIGTIDTKTLISKIPHDEDGRITIERDGTKIQIVSAKLERNVEGKVFLKDKDGIAYLEEIINIGSSAPTTVREAERKTLTLALFNMKSGVDSYSGNPEECNFNDPVIYEGKPQERKVQIRVELKKVQGPAIDSARFEPDRIRKGDEAKLIVKFKSPKEAAKVEFVYKKPEGGSDFTQGLVQDNDNREFWRASIETSDFVYAGDVKGKVAAYKEENSNVKSEHDASFKIFCGDVLSPGLCDISCRQSNIINTGLTCSQLGATSAQSVVCCKT